MSKTQIEVISGGSHTELQERVNSFLSTLEAYVINIRYQIDTRSDYFYAFIHYDPNMVLTQRGRHKQEKENKS